MAIVAAIAIRPNVQVAKIVLQMMQIERVRLLAVSAAFTLIGHLWFVCLCRRIVALQYTAVEFI